MRGVVVLGVLLLVHTATGTISALGSTNCKTLKDSKTNSGNLNTNQCSKVTYDEIHHCACENDADCTWGGPGTNSAWANNFVCCRPARAATAGSNYALGRCIDVTSEHCCQFEYGTSNNPGYVVQALSTATKPRCCARRVPIGFGTANVRPAYLSTPNDFQFTDCSCTADSDCNEGAPYCCANRCSATTCACTADSDCTGSGQVCCSTGNADASAKRCVSTDNCCVFNHYVNTAADNYRRNWKKIFDPETQACCPYGSVVRVLTDVPIASGVEGSGLSISDDSFGLTDIDGVFIYTRATNPLRRCRCTGNTGAPANGRLANGPTTSGCSEGETCCELTGDMINNNWMVTRLSASLFDSVQCDPEKPHCLDSCMGMCSSKCEASCIGALLYPNAGTSVAAKYQILAPENLRCCRFETSRTRVLPLSDSATTTTQNKRFETSYYTPTLEKSGSKLVRQYCCTYDGVRSTNKNSMPSCDKCYVDADCTANGEITYAGSENLRCCGADQEKSQLGSCIDSRTEHCCLQGTATLPSSESVSTVLGNNGVSDCACATDADCPESVTDGPSWGCCIKPGDEKGVCFTSDTRQCCGGIVISWESYCCATAAQLAVGDAKEFTRSAADRRWSPSDSDSQCPCNDAADCAGITFEGAAAPGTWECCAPGDDECGLCYNTEEEQCCTAGPAALSGKIMVANGVTLMTSSFKPFAEMCCKLTGPASRWTRAAGSDKGRSGVGAGNTRTDQLDMRGANGGDPVNDCLCKTDEDCAEGYKCCHLTHDNPAHDEEEEDDLFGATPLFFATKGNHLRAIELLMKHGAKVDEPNKYGVTPLHYACRERLRPIINRLLSFGANIGLPCEAGHTPFYTSIEETDVPTVQLLLQHLETLSETPPLHPPPQCFLSANKLDDNEDPHCCCWTPSATKWDLLNYPTVNHRSTPLICAARETCQQIVTDLLRYPVVKQNINYKNIKGWTALHYAISEGCSATTKILLSHGADVSVVSVKGLTPLVLAARENEVKIGKLLLKHGADINLPDTHHKYTPLNTACDEGNVDFVKMLLTNPDCNILKPSKTGITPLMTVVEEEEGKILGLLLKHAETKGGYAMPWKANHRGWNVIHIAAQVGNIDIIYKMLDFVKAHPTDKIIAEAVSVPYVNKDNITKNAAKITQHQENVKKIKLDTHINTTTTSDNDGGGGLNASEITFEIKEDGQNDKPHEEQNGEKQFQPSEYETPKPEWLGGTNLLMMQDLAGRTPLHVGIAQAFENGIATLLGRCGSCADIQATKWLLTARDQDGCTPLHVAAEIGNIPICKYLLDTEKTIFSRQSSAICNIADYFGFTPLHNACMYGRSDVAKLLVEAGAAADESVIKCVVQTDNHDVLPSSLLSKEMCEVLERELQQQKAADQEAESEIKDLIPINTEIFSELKQKKIESMEETTAESDDGETTVDDEEEEEELTGEDTQEDSGEEVEEDGEDDD